MGMVHGTVDARNSLSLRAAVETLCRPPQEPPVRVTLLPPHRVAFQLVFRVLIGYYFH